MWKANKKQFIYYLELTEISIFFWHAQFALIAFSFVFFLIYRKSSVFFFFFGFNQEDVSFYDFEKYVKEIPNKYRFDINYRDLLLKFKWQSSSKDDIGFFFYIRIYQNCRQTTAMVCQQNQFQWEYAECFLRQCRLQNI